MNKYEHNHFHSYQDQKDAFDEKLDELSIRILSDLWFDCTSISEAISESLAESKDYAAITKYCRMNNSATLLGAITLDLIDLRLSEVADELAEKELT